MKGGPGTQPTLAEFFRRPSVPVPMAGRSGRGATRSRSRAPPAAKPKADVPAAVPKTAADVPAAVPKTAAPAAEPAKAVTATAASASPAEQRAVDLLSDCESEPPAEPAAPAVEESSECVAPPPDDVIFGHTPPIADPIPFDQAALRYWSVSAVVCL